MLPFYIKNRDGHRIRLKYDQYIEFFSSLKNYDYIPSKEEKEIEPAALILDVTMESRKNKK